ncbi:MAG: cytochrome P460 family protein [Thermoanaerobaculia bacterium]
MRLALVVVLATQASTLPPELLGYKQWAAATKEPHPIPMQLWTQCSLPTHEQESSAIQEHGPHAKRYVRVFGNGIASHELIAKGTPHFPVGSIIVKEKLLSSSERKPEAIAAMIKREAGFNKATGDWDFMFIRDGKVAVETSSCAKCHESRADQDYVFRSYLP